MKLIIIKGNIPSYPNKKINEFILSKNNFNSTKQNNISTEAYDLSNYNRYSNPYKYLTETKQIDNSQLNIKSNNFNFSNKNLIDNPNNSSSTQEINNINLNELTLNVNLAYIGSKKNWTKEEDEILVNFVKTNNGRNWKKISSILKTKTAQQCSYRYNKIITLKNEKKFTRNEDIQIIELIEKFGFNWDEIIKYFPHRKKQQIIDRYYNKLNTGNKRKVFEQEEDALLLKLRNIHGNNWNEIAKHFKDASITMLKNRYYGYLKKRISLSSGVINNSNSMESFENSNSHNWNNYNNIDSINKNQLNSNNSDFENNEEKSETYEDVYYRDSGKSYEPMNYKMRNELMNSILNNQANDHKNISNANNFNEYRCIYVNNNQEELVKPNINYSNNFSKDYLLPTNNLEDSYFNQEAELNSKYKNTENDSINFPGNDDLFYNFNYEEFLKDFEKLKGNLFNHYESESYQKENSNESKIIDSYYNSHIDYNSTSLLDLLDDDIFTVDFSNKSKGNSWGSFNTSNNSIENLLGNSIKYSNDIENNQIASIDFIKDSNSLNPDNDKKSLNKFYYSNNYKDNHISGKEEQDNFNENKSMQIDEKEVFIIPDILINNYDDYNEKIINASNYDKKFQENFNLLFNQERIKKENFSKSNSAEIKENFTLRIREIEQIKVKNIEKTNFNINDEGKENENKGENNIIINKKENKLLIKQYKSIQNVYVKYKKFKNYKIKTKNNLDVDSNIEDNIKMILESEKNLNDKSKILHKELIQLRKDYKKYAKNIKKDKAKTSFDKNKNISDSLYLRNSLIKQIDIFLKLINTIKVKIDLIRKFNNEFGVSNTNNE